MIPKPVTDLLQELEPDDISVGSTTSSKMLILDNEGDEISINAEGCEKLLQSTETVEKLYSVLGNPADVSVELHGLELGESVIEKLGELFKNVEEY